ncbi:hypothetical protein CLAFUW4_02287 [Fulvia fulva]|uniref:Uncharacterized protein n=1 Tax=Passalora fulva TaxID=5499 RepID=A0A9Q8P2U2_PASFU|nr:uncharacterized protein CLAFUR5_02277 [Fulvia fulva]KAK4638502.1 hypothetical protein CLAFUR0_02286 [Fulvia fulva]UJO11027.1 hypothetical protein CLAFUR5_02277 [Fulvia fulva]WPV10411.1 hypothetical protein CLAFUW4_02287 [Fulvia fulva]
MLPILSLATDHLHLVRYLPDHAAIQRGSQAIAGPIGPFLTLASAYLSEHGYSILSLITCLLIGGLVGFCFSESSKTGTIIVGDWTRGRTQKTRMAMPRVPVTSRKKNHWKEELAIKNARIKSLQSDVNEEKRHSAYVEGELVDLSAQLRQKDILMAACNQNIETQNQELAALRSVHEHATQRLTETITDLGNHLAESIIATEEQAKRMHTEANVLVHERDAALKAARKAKHDLESFYCSKELRGYTYTSTREHHRQQTYISSLEGRVQNLSEVLSAEREQK